MEASSTYSSYYQHKQTYNLLIEYNKVLKQVQHSHSEMLRLLSYFSLVFNKQVIHVLQEHVNLGKRVIHVHLIATLMNMVLCVLGVDTLMKSYRLYMIGKSLG